ncbi:MAG: hypothetical protein AB7F59_14150 [Bdellovibrionales bacterium]
MLKNCLSILGALTFVAQTTWAAETAKVLPKGIFRARVVGIQTQEFSQKFNEHGQIENLSAPLNKSLTAKDLAAQNPKLDQLVQAMNKVQEGSGDKLLNANLYGDFSLQVSTILPALEYGVTDELSVGIRIPIVKRTGRASFRADYTNNAASLKNQLGQLSTPELAAGLDQVGQLQLDTNFFAESVFTKNGYEVPHDFEKTEAGDLEFGAKYNFYKNAGFFATALWGARAPTGSNPSLTNIYDKGTGNGAWATCVQLFQEYEVNPYLMFGAAEKVTYNFTDTRARAVPKDANDALPNVKPEAGQVQDVKREQGMQLDTELSTTVFMLDKTVNMWGAYQYTEKGADKYSGPGELYYEGLGKNSDQVRQAGELGVGYSTVPAFRRKQFSVPMEVQALYNHALSGKNVPDFSYGRMDLIVYF